MKIAVLSINLAFFDTIQKELEKRHTLRFWKGSEDQMVSYTELGGLCEWADLIWLEFAQHPLELVIDGFPEKKIVTTCHRAELYIPIYRLNWSAVDLVLFTCNHVKRRFYDFLEIVNKERGTPSNKPKRDYVNQHPVYDGELFKWTPRKYEPPYKICTAGHIVPKKRTYTTIQMFADLPKEFNLYILGKHFHLEGYGNREYLHNVKDLIKILGLEERVFFREWMPFNEMPLFYAGQDLLIHNSNEEARSRVIAESMAMGVYPLINHWRGAEELYPKKHIFDTPSEFVEKVLAWADLNDEEKLKESKGLSRGLATTQEEAKLYAKEVEKL